MSEAAIYFSLVWAVAALAGISRSINNGDYRGWAHCLSVGGVAGFLGFGVVGLLCRQFDSDGFDKMYYLGVASVIGLAGKEQTELITLLWRHLINKLKATDTK